MHVSVKKLWAAVCKKLQSELGASVANSWITPLVVDKLEGGTVYLSAPSMFLRDWVQNNYYDQILKHCSQANNEITKIEILVSESNVNVVTEENTEVTTTNKILQSKQKSDEQLEISIPLDPRLTFDNFVVGKPNEFAYAAALRIAESDQVAFNPLFLYGSVGLGKTHLMNAIAWSIKLRDPDRTIAYLSAEKFMYHFIRAIRHKDTVAFKEQFICGKDQTQEEFFHTFNTLVDNRRQVIISADKSPSDLEGMEERLKSRLGWGLVADIHPTTYELRLGILQAKSASLSVTVPNKVLEFVAHKITSNIRELEGALNRIVASAVFVGREITVESAREVLSDLLRTSERKVTIDEIQKKVASHYAIKLSDMSSVKRDRKVSLPRQVAMYLSKRLTTQSLPEIGKNFGDRDHTTVLHAIKKIEEAIKSDLSLAEDLRLLFQVLEKPT